MKLEKMFKKTEQLVEEQEEVGLERHPEVPEGLLMKCDKCGTSVFSQELKKSLFVCPKCGKYMNLYAWTRLSSIVDAGSFVEWDTGIKSNNPLDFKGYAEKVEGLKEKTGLDEAIVTGFAKISGIPVAIGVCDSRFLMSSMGYVVGEKITRMVERATEERLPVVLFACSGGARMQEGIVSLMQMAKTSAAFKRHSDAGLLYISVLTHPTTGGVTASFAMLGDVIIAEPDALIGFAGPRVIEQTIGQKLPEGFQRSEFLLKHGFVDRIVAREKMREELSVILALHGEAKKMTEVSFTEATVSHGTKELTPWERVLKCRQNDRPTALHYIATLFESFVEFHGDRYFADDSAIVGGVAYFHGMPVTVIAQAKGRTTKENIERNFAMPSPEGYRKALRLMKQAEKFHRPIICFVDTPGAFCGMEAEERGQGEAIAKNLYEMSSLKVPVLSIVIGEGGSGGALALAVSDEVWILENAIYSILSPEGFASILWKDSKRAKEAAEVMKLTAYDLLEKNIVEQVIGEPEDFSVETMKQVTDVLDGKIVSFLHTYGAMSEAQIMEHRYRRFRNL